MCAGALDIDAGTVALVAVSGITVVGGAYALIISAAGGENGLGAFLQDGTGYKKSAYRENRGRTRRVPAFIDELKFPRFDYVEVFSPNDAVVEKAEEMRVELAAALRDGDDERAARIQAQLETYVAKNNLKFDSEDA